MNRPPKEEIEKMLNDPTTKLVVSMTLRTTELGILKILREATDILDELGPVAATLKLAVMGHLVSMMNLGTAGLIQDEGPVDPRKFSKELVLYAALINYFIGQKSLTPHKDAGAMLKSLGHEVPEKMIPWREIE